MLELATPSSNYSLIFTAILLFCMQAWLCRKPEGLREDVQPLCTDGQIYLIKMKRSNPFGGRIRGDSTADHL